MILLLITIMRLSLKTLKKIAQRNVMIVDLLRNDLGKVASPGSVKVPAIFQIESFCCRSSFSKHSYSKISRRYKTAIDQLEAAFPGGSITGAPKIRAMQIIEELEPHRRSIYCGSIGILECLRQHGYQHHHHERSYAIKNHNQIHCWAGGGIVADSTR